MRQSVVSCLCCSEHAATLICRFEGGPGRWLIAWAGPHSTDRCRVRWKTVDDPARRLGEEDAQSPCGLSSRKHRTSERSHNEGEHDVKRKRQIIMGQRPSITNTWHVISSRRRIITTPARTKEPRITRAVAGAIRSTPSQLVQPTFSGISPFATICGRTQLTLNNMRRSSRSWPGDSRPTSIAMEGKTDSIREIERRASSDRD
jgi:hypothetical protein